MYRTPLVLALCCVLAITDVSPLADEHPISQNIPFKSQDGNNDIAKIVLTTDKPNVCEENTNIELSAMKKELLESHTKLRDMVEALIKKQDNLADQISGFERTFSNRGGEEVGWWRTICQDPDDGQRGFKEDIDDSRLRSITGCDISRSNYILGKRPQDGLVVRLAILAAPGSRTDTNLYLFIDDRMIFYFEFFSETGRLQVYKTEIFLEPILLWEAELLTPKDGRQHYLPLELRFAEDGLWWGTGCGDENRRGGSYSSSAGFSTTDDADRVVTRISVFFAALLISFGVVSRLKEPQIPSGNSMHKYLGIDNAGSTQTAG